VMKATSAGWDLEKAAERRVILPPFRHPELVSG
jgi:hypothetical protein